MMDSTEKKAYAEYLIRQHAQDVEHLTIFEMFDYFPGYRGDEISELDANDVATLIGKAKIEITFP